MTAPTPYLAGNCDPCDACALRREAMDMGALVRPHVLCNVCGGRGCLPLDAAEICRRTVEEARRIYWPAFDRRIAGDGRPRHPATEIGA